MNIKFRKWLKYGMLGTLALAGFSACSDDHFDIKSSTPKQTLWEEIASNPQLDSLKMILERTTFTVDEFSKTSQQLSDLHDLGSGERHIQRCQVARSARSGQEPRG